MTRTTQRRQLGVTLMELLIVVALVAIIGSLAVPSYMERMDRMRRNDARIALLSIANAQEQFFLDSGVYSNDVEALIGSDTSEHDHYDLTLAMGAGNTSYVAKATAVGSQLARDETCKEFFFSSTGARTASGGNDAECWGR